MFKLNFKIRGTIFDFINLINLYFMQKQLEINDLKYACCETKSIETKKKKKICLFIHIVYETL